VIESPERTRTEVTDVSDATNAENVPANDLHQGPVARAIRVIVGPTAAGKSAYAMALAEREPIAIISADSRQIYRGFDIGTGKPTAEERARVVHYGVDIVNPTEHYSAYQWAKDALRWIDDALTRGLEPVIVGGTGFYIKSLFDPPYDEPPIEGLRYAPAYHIIDPGVATNRHYIETRVAGMLEHGWAEEVRHLMHTVPADAIAWKACGYRNIRKYVEGEYPLSYATDRTIIETRQYAKRQRTWFRHQLP
jgi:tRNA A37 N6-isopentenylltransferase MiaA